jgi:beta-N-acetylhexosaminidase
MLISADLENGGNGIAHEGTIVGSPMQIAATNDDRMAYKLGSVCGVEGSALGCNWALAPIVDIDYNFRNPVNNIRTFGSNIERICRMGIQYIKGVQKNGVAACIKHFPGDGIDERNQHIVASVNSLSCDKWDSSFGTVYKACIDAGVMTVLFAPIMLPEYSKKFAPGIKDEDILPSILSYDICTKLLKEQMGFNGLIVTNDSTTAGMMFQMPRSAVVPKAIAAGCDMFLFARNLEEDFEYMKNGIREGIITQERLNDALTKILALKAALRLHVKRKENTLVPKFDQALKILGNTEHRKIADECADKSITLVKSRENIFPVLPEKYKRILFHGIDNGEGATLLGKKSAVVRFKELLEKQGFEVDQFDPKPELRGSVPAYAEITEQYDLIIYLADIAAAVNKTIVRIEWEQSIGTNLPIFIPTVPTIFISVENPYLLFDVPRVKTYINTYGSTDEVLEALIEKLMGKSEFKGISPVDAFCGVWDTKL